MHNFEGLLKSNLWLCKRTGSSQSVHAEPVLCKAESFYKAYFQIVPVC